LLAEKYLLLLETLRKASPNQGQTHPDGSPKVVSSSPHIPVTLLEHHRRDRPSADSQATPVGENGNSVQPLLWRVA
jgi:hypothetical protein